MTLGEQIFNLRKQKGFTQEEIAELVGVSRQTIHKWENDVIQPNSDNIVALSNVLGINSEELLSSVYPVQIKNEPDNVAFDNENNAESEVAITDKEQVESKLGHHIIKIVIILAVMLLVAITITVWMGVIIGTTQKADMVESNYNINSIFFIVMCIISSILFVIESILTIRIMKKKKDRK